MQRIKYWMAVMVACVAIIVLLSGCDSASNLNDSTGVVMRDYYTIEDFQSITIGESTYQDICQIAYTESVQITSYGGFCEYPLKNGGCIRIKFYGESLIVGAIEEIKTEGQGDGLREPWDKGTVLLSPDGSPSNDP